MAKAAVFIPNAPKASSQSQHNPVPAYRFYVPQDKAKRKSRAALHRLEFLSAVFASDGASRFFKTFLLRYLFDSGKNTSEDYSTVYTTA